MTWSAQADESKFAQVHSGDVALHSSRQSRLASTVGLLFRSLHLARRLREDGHGRLGVDVPP
jgi:hypothetical protein